MLRSKISTPQFSDIYKRTSDLVQQPYFNFSDNYAFYGAAALSENFRVLDFDDKGV
jgi:hypothetical protein